MGSVGALQVELAYVEMPATVDIVSTSEAAPTEVVAAPEIELDGDTRIKIEFFCPIYYQHQGGGISAISLWDDETDLGRFGVFSNPGGVAETDVAVYLTRYLTPEPGPHIFRITGYKLTISEAKVVSLSYFGGVYVPAWLRVSTA